MFNVTAILEMPLGAGGITIWSLLYFTLILVIGVLIARLVSINVRRALMDRLPVNERELLTKLVYYGIAIVALLAALPQLNVDLSGLLVAGGIAGIVIGFASQSVISNLISGLFLMFERPIRIGDNINVSDVTGSVEDIRILSTVIKTFDGIYIRIPNEKVFTSNITNYVHNVARRFSYQIGIRYQDDAALAIRIAKDVIEKHPFALRNPSPSVFVDNLGDNGVNLTVFIWAPARNWWEVRTDLLWKIKRAFEENGIQIPFPQRTVWFPERIEVEQRSAVEEK
ncbi:mechanosensitive ion channel family protein [Methanoculleus sp.]|uniref:mechanosensitive ion channel family protein n=1 Tax=Methanoculleus sp. TaxID=90427 RepID=UPI002626F9F6|nr:mechanosensitive ion channel family protein [Methanoculleus sp.]MDI6867639.1 mechanosensitive ion channel family protein [Methanoculleus sp.]